MMCSIINFYDMRLKEGDLVSKVSALFSCYIFIALMIALYVIFKKIWRLSRNIKKESVNEFKSHYPILTDSMKDTLTSKIVFFWKPLYLLRWLMTLLLLITLRENPTF
jgi:amino acid permease